MTNPAPDPGPIPSSASAQSPGEIRIALAQIAPKLGDRERNVTLHEQSIRDARDQGADLIVFPELSLTGYFLRDMVPDVALSSSAAELVRLGETAGPSDVVVGFVERSPRHRYYNSGIYFEAGQARHIHRKVYLPTYGLFDEQRYFAAGHRIKAFDTQRFGRVGLLVCEDFWHISAAAIMQAEEVDLLICISNSPGRGVQQSEFSTASIYEHVSRTYAVLLGAVVVVVNRVGFEDGLCFWGGSRVVAPNGDVIAEAPQLDESLTIASFLWEDLRRERTTTPLARDERLLLTIEELKRVKRRHYGDST